MNPLSQALVRLADDRARVLEEVLTQLTRQKLACKSAENLVNATREATKHIGGRCQDLLTLNLHVPEPNYLNTLLPVEKRKKVLDLIRWAVEISELDLNWTIEQTNGNS